MAEPPTARSTRALTYVLFNGSWDRVVSNRIDQGGRPVAREADALPTYLAYLVNSLSSVAATAGAGQPPRVRIWLVEIEPGALEPEALRARLAADVPQVQPDIAFVGHGWVRPFIEEALRIPDGLYRSPNRLHEAMIFLAVRESPERHLVFADPDVTFIAPGAVDRLVAALEGAPEKLAAGFIERTGQRPWRGEMIPARERLHTVACVFDAEGLRREFPLSAFIEASPFDARLDTLRDASAVEYYRRYRVLDSLSLFTDWARACWQSDRILALNHQMKHFAEGAMLVIVCEELVHAKYLQAGAAGPLRAAIAQAKLPHTPLLDDLVRRAKL